MIHLVAVFDVNILILAFDLTAIELACKGRDVGVGCVAPQSVEVLFHFDFLHVDDDEPGT